MLLLMGALIGAAAAASAAPGVDQPTWVVTLNRVPAYSGPTPQAVAFGDVPAATILQVLDYQGDFARLLDPRSNAVAFVASDQIGPSDAPSRYLLMPPPRLSEEFEAAGVVTDPAPMAVYPTWADEAVDRQLNPNTWLSLTGQVDADDGTTWYRTASAGT